MDGPQIYFYSCPHFLQNGQTLRVEKCLIEFLVGGLVPKVGKGCLKIVISLCSSP